MDVSPLRLVIVRLLVASLLAFAAAGLSPASVARAQPDSVRAAVLDARGLPPDHTPRKALRRALVLPGWGQVYNRQYLKLPLVYAGLVGLGYRVARANRNYRTYQDAAIYAQALEDDVPGDDLVPNPALQDAYESVLRDVGASPGTGVRPSLIRSERDGFRRRRDLAIIGTGVFYALSVIDAFVSAHLLAFDVGEDLSMQVLPGATPPPPGVPALGPSALGPSALGGGGGAGAAAWAPTWCVRVRF
jgi:hypothetical protein